MGEKPVDSHYELALQLAQKIENLLGASARSDAEYNVLLTQALARGLTDQLVAMVQTLRAARPEPSGAVATAG